MRTQTLTDKERKAYNRLVGHPLQSYEWGEFRENTGVKVIRRGIYEKGTLVGGFTLTIHKIPKTSFTIGYLPKGVMPDAKLIKTLKEIGREEKCIFIQLEPNVKESDEAKRQLKNLSLRTAAHPLFTKYTFVLDLKPCDEEKGQ